MRWRIGGLSSVLSMFSLLSYCLAQADWENSFNARNDWASQKTFIWKAECEVQLNTQAVASEIERIQQRTGSQIAPRDKHHSLSEIKIRRNGESASIEYTVLESSRFGKGTVFILMERDFVALTKSTPGGSSYHTSIFPTEVPALLLALPTIAVANDEVRGVHPTFLALTPPQKTYTPLGMQHPIRKIAYSSHTEANGDVTLKISVPESNLSGTIRLSKAHQYAPIECKFVEGSVVKEWKTTEWTKKEGYVIPKTVTYSEKQRLASLYIEYKLTSTEKTNENFEIPEISSIADYRLCDMFSPDDLMTFQANRNKAVLYPYEGRLPTREELKALALNRGLLAPEQNSRRRYSLVLFAPALLFFAGALYLYWRQKRR